MTNFFHSRMAELTFKHLSDRLTEPEKEELSRLLASSKQKRKLFDKLSNGNYLLGELIQYSKVDENALWKRHQKKLRLKRPMSVWDYVTVALLLVVMVIAIYYLAKDCHK